MLATDYVQSFHHITLQVRNLSLQRRAYQEVLRLPVYRQPSLETKVAWFLFSETSLDQLHLVETETVKPLWDRMEQARAIGLLVPDWEGFVTHLVAHQWRYWVVEEAFPGDPSVVRRILYCVDPEGNLLACVSQPLQGVEVPPMKAGRWVARLEWVRIPVNQLDRAEQFYRRGLGFCSVEAPSLPHNDGLWLQPPGGYPPLIHLVPSSEDKPRDHSSEGDHIALFVPNSLLSPFREFLTSLGYGEQILLPKTVVPESPNRFFLIDSSGFRRQNDNLTEITGLPRQGGVTP